jgi:hypothetical protein
MDTNSVRFFSEGLPFPALPCLTITSMLLQKLLVASRFNNAAVLHDMDEIGLHGGGEAVADDEDGATRGKVAKAGEPSGFGPDVEHTGGFIQNDKLCLTKKCPCKRYPLPLPCAEFCLSRPFAEHRLKTFGQARDNCVRSGGSCCCLDCCFIRIS